MASAALRHLLRVAAIAGCGLAGTAACGEEQVATAVKDEIFARKILMDTIDRYMDEIDWMLVSGKPIDLAEATDHADTVSVMLLTLPHLFPRETNRWQPDAKRDPGRDTYASPDLWSNFADFYRRANEASQIAYDAAHAREEGAFRKSMAALREACDSCHALYMKTDP